jgi:hypothetical protein
MELLLVVVKKFQEVDVKQEQQVLKVPKEHKVLKVLKVPMEHKVLKEPKDFKELKVLQAHKVQ